MTLTLNDIAKHLDAELIGDGAQPIIGLAPIQSATAQQVSFINNPKYVKYLADTQASAVIVDKALAEQVKVAKLVVPDAYVAYAKVSALFAKIPTLPAGVHATAVVAESASIGHNTGIGPGVVIGERVVIGANCQIHAGTIIGDDVVIGDDSCLWSRVTLYYRVKLGKRVIVHSGAVIGSDGFGMANQQGKWIKIYQLGSVIIGDDVEIGAQTAIDRGAIGDTVIGQGVKLDNLIQIGHNVQIGEHTAIAGNSAIAGSTTIGKYCMISGRVTINGHVTITDRVIVTGNSTVHNDLKEPGVYSSGTYAIDNKVWRRNAYRFTQLDEMAKRIRRLEHLSERVDEHT